MKLVRLNISDLDLHCPSSKRIRRGFCQKRKPRRGGVSYAAIKFDCYANRRRRQSNQPATRDPNPSMPREPGSGTFVAGGCAVAPSTPKTSKAQKFSRVWPPASQNGKPLLQKKLPPLVKFLRPSCSNPSDRFGPLAKLSYSMMLTV